MHTALIRLLSAASSVTMPTQLWAYSACDSWIQRPDITSANSQLPPECAQGVALALDSETTLWRCAINTDRDSDDPSATDLVVLDREGAKPRSWPDLVSQGRRDAFYAINADLDGDGQSELIVAVWNTASNGIGIQYWTLRIFAHDLSEIGLLEDVHDWSPSLLIAAPGNRRGCDLAVPEFAETDAGEMALTVRFVTLAAGQLSPATDRTSISTSYTRRLERARTRHFGNGAIEGNVLQWIEK